MKRQEAKNLIRVIKRIWEIGSEFQENMRDWKHNL